VPFCRDQFDVARRVEVADAGVRLHHKRLNPRRLRAAVFEAMAKRAGAEHVAEAFAAAGGASAAADEVEELLPARSSELQPPPRRASLPKASGSCRRRRIREQPSPYAIACVRFRHQPRSSA
jgi:hypothetical protein